LAFFYLFRHQFPSSNKPKAKYSQTWSNDHLQTLAHNDHYFWVPISVFIIKLPLNYDQLSTTATILVSRGWSSYTSLTIFLWCRYQQTDIKSFLLHIRIHNISTVSFAFDRGHGHHVHVTGQGGLQLRASRGLRWRQDRHRRHHHLKRQD